MIDQTRRPRHWAQAAMRILPALGMAILLVTSCGGREDETAEAWREPDGFKGVRWGSAPEELRRVLAVPGCVWEGNEYTDGSVGYRLKGGCDFGPGTPRWEVSHIGDVQIVAPEPIATFGPVFYYHGGRMGQVEFTFEPGDYKKLRDAFVERYGPPTGRKVQQYQNAFGARFASEEVEWVGKKVRLLLEERTGGNLTKGVATFETPEFVQARKAAEGAEAQRRREGL